MLTHLKAIKETRLSLLLKWAGGKEQELKYIHPAMPIEINNYYEPFVGGGAVYLSFQVKKCLPMTNRMSLSTLYNAIKEQYTDFFNIVNEIIYNWELLEQIIEKNSDIICY